MKKVLIAYFSGSGTTEAMAQYIAEGVRIAGHEVELKKIGDVTGAKELAGYDALILGSPTYHLDMPQPLKTFFSIAEKAGLAGKVGGAFGSRTHPSSGGGGAAAMIFDLMESRFKMRMTNLGPFELEGGLTGHEQDMHTCQEYGKSVAALLGQA